MTFFLHLEAVWEVATPTPAAAFVRRMEWTVIPEWIQHLRRTPPGGQGPQSLSRFSIAVSLHWVSSGHGHPHLSTLPKGLMVNATQAQDACFLQWYGALCLRQLFRFIRT